MTSLSMNARHIKQGLVAVAVAVGLIAFVLLAVTWYNTREVKYAYWAAGSFAAVIAGVIYLNKEESK